MSQKKPHDFLFFWNWLVVRAKNNPHRASPNGRFVCYSNRMVFWWERPPLGDPLRLHSASLFSSEVLRQGQGRTTVSCGAATFPTVHVLVPSSKWMDHAIHRAVFPYCTPTNVSCSLLPVWQENDVPNSFAGTSNWQPSSIAPSLLIVDQKFLLSSNKFDSICHKKRSVMGVRWDPKW